MKRLQWLLIAALLLTVSAHIFTLLLSLVHAFIFGIRRVARGFKVTAYRAMGRNPNMDARRVIELQPGENTRLINNPDI